MGCRSFFIYFINVKFFGKFSFWFVFCNFKGDGLIVGYFVFFIGVFLVLKDVEFVVGGGLYFVFFNKFKVVFFGCKIVFKRYYILFIGFCYWEDKVC